eukprot:g29471.t1
MTARGRSRSPYRQQLELSLKEIRDLVLAREQARLQKDWKLADNIRSQLHDAGVQLFDKTHQWTSTDGRSGRIPSFDEVEAGQVPEEEEIPTTQIKEYIEPSEGDLDKEQIQKQLQDLGVELQDKEKLWKCMETQLQGIIIGFRNNELSDVEVHTLVTQREKARMANDYELSDMIRDELKSRGVVIEDKQKVWTCTDGRRGAVPSWAQITGEAPAHAMW